jgi:8-amino-7-oxononanoate synthase
MLPTSLQQKLDTRRQQGALRELRLSALATDFCSNDYLGIARERLLVHDPSLTSGSGGSRLLAGNYPLLTIVEEEIAAFHAADSALIYNSGYDANVGLLSSVPQKGDTVLYDALAHASIRDGIRLSFASAHAFRHNDLEDLERKLRLATGQSPAASSAPGPAVATGNVFVVTETLFSMDGDFCPLRPISDLCLRYGAWLIVDEAHATGVIGARGEGMVGQEGLEAQCFARVHTFGKALGCHGAVVLGSPRLKEYLVNFSRALIYTTALPPASAGLIRKAYGLFPGMEKERLHLQTLIARFQSSDLPFERLTGTTPIQIVVVPGNENVRRVAAQIQQAGLDVRPILYPTVPKETERLRIVLHAFNTEAELELLLRLLMNTAKNM